VYFILLSLLAVMAGCSSRNLAFDPVSLRNPKSESAEVVVIREPTRFMGQKGSASDRWVVGVDGRNIGELLPGQYTFFSVPTNDPHAMEIKRWDMWWHKASLPVILEPGKRYYYVVGVFDLFSSGISATSEEQGKAWMAKSRYVPVKNAL